MEPKRLGKDKERQANSEKRETIAGRADNEEGSFWKALRAHDIPCRPQRPSSPNTTPPVRHHLVFRIIPQNKRANLPRRSRCTRALQLPLGKISHRDDATTRQQFSRNNHSVLSSDTLCNLRTTFERAPRPPKTDLKNQISNKLRSKNKEPIDLPLLKGSHAPQPQPRQP